MGIGDFAAKGAVGGWSSIWRSDGTNGWSVCKLREVRTESWTAKPPRMPT